VDFVKSGKPIAVNWSFFVHAEGIDLNYARAALPFALPSKQRLTQLNIK
jgi:hypothetical protein